MRRVAIYCRISQDRVGAGLGVERQRQDCERLVAERGWTTTAVYSDNDVSAYSGRPRPAYKQLLADIAARNVDVVVAWHTDRLHRSPLELEDYITACERSDVATITVRSGELDLATAAGRMVARMLGAAARHESEQKSERIKRAREQEARSGRSHGHLGYGYRREEAAPSGWVIYEPEALIIREIADRLLSGDTLTGIARDLNRREVPTPAQKVGAWRGVNIRSLVTAGRYCGWREYTPGIQRGDRGRGRGMGNLVAQGEWPAILDLRTTEELRVLLSDPARRSEGRPGRATYLLSGGLARCGRCGAPLAGHHDGKRRTRRYECVNQPGLDRCGRLTIAAEALDGIVVAALLQVLSGPGVGGPWERGQEDEDEKPASASQMSLLRERLDELARLFGQGEITQQEWLTARTAINDRLVAAQTAIRTETRRLVVENLPSDETSLRAHWDSLRLEQKRSLVEEILRSIVVSPARRRGNRVDPSRVTLNWRA